MAVLLGIDYGRRRVGLAVSDPTGVLASPLGCHDTRTNGSLRERLQHLVTEYNVAGFVVGLPLTADGRRTASATAAERFADLLRGWFGLPVHLVDERYSSLEATRCLQVGGRRRRPKGDIDAAAAALILQQFLDGEGRR